MEVSACLPDEMLVQEGALRAHNLIAPLLALEDAPKFVHKALAAARLALQGISNLVQVRMRSTGEDEKSIVQRNSIISNGFRWSQSLYITFTNSTE